MTEQLDENRVKAQKYDDLMKANSDIVQNNINTTKEHQALEELKEKIFYKEYCPNQVEGKVCDLCIFKGELETILKEYGVST